MGKDYRVAMHIKGIGLKRSTDEFQGRLFAALGIAEPDQSVVSDADRVISFFQTGTPVLGCFNSQSFDLENRTSV